MNNLEALNNAEENYCLNQLDSIIIAAILELNDKLETHINLKNSVDNELPYIVLDPKTGYCVMKDIVAIRKFDNESNDFDTSELKKWLNDTWLPEQPFEDIEGEVSLLSADEAIEYFEDNDSRIAHYEGIPFWWWLRSRGVDGPRSAAYVNHVGDVHPGGWYHVGNTGGVRPAFHLKSESSSTRTNVYQKSYEAGLAEGIKRNENANAPIALSMKPIYARQTRSVVD